MSSKPNCSTTTAGVKTRAASTERALWRVWIRCTKQEETSKFLSELVSLGVGVACDEEFILSEERRMKASKLKTKNRVDLAIQLSKIKLKDANKILKKTLKTKNKLRKRLANEVSQRRLHNYQSKVKEHCLGLKSQLRQKNQAKARWLVQKYRKEKIPQLEDDLKRYEECEIFKEECTLKAHAIEGAVIVNMTGENIKLSECEMKLLKRGPKYINMPDLSRIYDERGVYKPSFWNNPAVGCTDNTDYRDKHTKHVTGSE